MILFFSEKYRPGDQVVMAVMAMQIKVSRKTHPFQLQPTTIRVAIDVYFELQIMNILFV
jgi:hypothetical protein